MNQNLNGCTCLVAGLYVDTGPDRRDGVSESTLRLEATGGSEDRSEVM